MIKPDERLVLVGKKLRKNSTFAERYLWKLLRAKRLEGCKFRRQQIIGKYIVDFVNFEKRLVIEVDGGQHNFPENESKDNKRTQWLKAQGFDVLRFGNNEVIKNVAGVLQAIRKSN